MQIDTDMRIAINTSLAKAIAYHNCGQHSKAQIWAAAMARMLQCADILKPEFVITTEENTITTPDKLFV